MILQNDMATQGLNCPLLVIFQIFADEVVLVDFTVHVLFGSKKQLNYLQEIVGGYLWLYRLCCQRSDFSSGFMNKLTGDSREVSS